MGVRRQDGIGVRVGALDGYTTVRAEPLDAVEIDMGRWWVERPEPGTPPEGQPPG